jgi:hypothetical protein
MTTACLSLLSTQSVVLATPAKPNPALIALKDEVLKMLVTFFAVAGFSHVLPLLMDAVMPLSKHFSSRLNTLGTIASLYRLPINNDICTCEEVVLFPLGAFAGFPLQTTYIAELSSAPASVIS